MKPDLQEEFRNRFNKDPEKIFFCPGRVNLIGEHIDYNGGSVMPCAITLGTWLAIARNTSKLLCFQSMNFPEKVELHLQNSYSKTGKQWFNYPLGTIQHILQSGHNISGLDMLFYGNLVIAAGLSSSASIEVLTGYALEQMFQLNIAKIDLALLSKDVENHFIGLNSGIMDQFAVAMGKKDKAILLNCDTLAYEYLPLEIGDHLLAIINTNKPRTLADSKYNERFNECREALSRLQKELPVENLCDINLHSFEEHRYLINDRLLEKRALHVISENFRVGEAVDALSAGELATFGKLMYASHKSLKEFYEVTGNELDTIVEFCKTQPAVTGARMTGAGFGGCAIALVKKKQFDDFASQIISYYTNKIGYAPGVFASEIGDGVREVSSEL